MTVYTYQFTAHNPHFADCNNETLYNGLCAATIPLDAGLDELHRRLKPIIVNAATAFLGALTWTMDDALGDALVLLWDLVRKRSYKTGAPFHSYFSAAWRQRLCSLFQKETLKGPVYVGDAKMGWAGRQPVYMMVYANHEKAEKYREARRERNARYYQCVVKPKKAAAQIAKPKPMSMTREEQLEKNRQRARAYWASLTPEQKREHHARSYEARKQKRLKEAAARIQREL